LAAGLLQPGDGKLSQQERTQLDRLDQRVVDDLNELMNFVGLKAPRSRQLVGRGPEFRND
jgi:hypothetical protein